LGRLDKFLINEKVIITGRVGTLGTVYIINKLTWISDNVLISKPIINNSFYFTYFTLKTFDLLISFGNRVSRVCFRVWIWALLDFIFLNNGFDKFSNFSKINLSGNFIKIELLQAQNKTLETTAQTIFKEWFGKYKIGDELPEGWRVELLFLRLLLLIQI
jgi:type I restriction enzyme S subunit